MDVVIGAVTSSGMNSAFQFSGNDLYVEGNIGSATSIYSNGSFIAGSGSTIFGNGIINKNDGNLILTASGGFITPATDLAVSLGSNSLRYNGGVFGNVTSTNTTSTNLFATTANITNLTVTGATPSSFTNIIWTNATGTNTTSTNLFASVLGFTTANGTSLTSANFIWTNATGTHTTTTNFAVSNGVTTNLNPTVDALLSSAPQPSVGTATLPTPLQPKKATTTNLAVTGLFSMPAGSAFNATNITWTNATGTNTTSTSPWHHRSIQPHDSPLHERHRHNPEPFKQPHGRWDLRLSRKRHQLSPPVPQRISTGLMMAQQTLSETTPTSDIVIGGTATTTSPVFFALRC